MYGSEREQNGEADMRKIFFRCFATRDGRAVLTFLRQQTVERSLSADIRPEELFYLEGQRSLVKYIERLAADCR